METNGGILLQKNGKLAAGAQILRKHHLGTPRKSGMSALVGNNPQRLKSTLRALGTAAEETRAKRRGKQVRRCES